MKKFLLSLAVTALVLASFAGCTAKPKGPVKVGIAIYKFDDTFMTNYRTEMEAYLKSKETADTKYEITITDGKNDQATQSEQIDNFISQNYDVLIINLVDLTAAGAIIAKVKAAKIPTVFINRQPTTDDMKLWDKITYVGAKAEDSGTYQGEIAKDLWDAGKLDTNKDGKLQYVMLMGQAIHQDAALRTEYSIKKLTDAGIVVEKLFEERANWNRDEGQTQMASAIAQFGAKIEVVFGNNDDMALGAIQALKAANMVVPVIGVDATAPALDAIGLGDLAGTVLNDSEGQAQTSVDKALALLAGEVLVKEYWVPYVKVTPANYKDFQ
ncbi:MAG: methyl-galactoside transport system substrate-binding protein [Erysipelotrichaceae bacterium]|nr:MAG: methyl-galactoside transport system substrate-binding [Erysipelotrichaceae bacterium]TXT17993.1 MAG: methyl-galactoside transport system substrate-binding protein [Erysipelotrichaceae bacterium]